MPYLIKDSDIKNMQVFEFDLGGIHLNETFCIESLDDNVTIVEEVFTMEVPLTIEMEDIHSDDGLILEIPIIDPTVIDLKELVSHLEYSCLKGDSLLLAITKSNSLDKDGLLTVLQYHKMKNNNPKGIERFNLLIFQ
ncbi:hypothetical protein Tco_0243852, partial [Tanacetum coccineum]